MRYCPSCKIKVEGQHEHCPLCQNELQGEEENRVYPSRMALRRQSIVYKIQLFVLISIMIISLAAEYLLDVNLGFRWSIIVSLWVVGGEIWLSGLIHRKNFPSKVVTHTGFWLAVLVMCTFIILDIKPIYFWWILPGLFVVAQVLHFVFMMTDRAHNAMVYFLGNSLLCILGGILDMVITKEKAILWVVSILIGLISLIGAVIFKGRRVTGELEKRFHI